MFKAPSPSKLFREFNEVLGDDNLLEINDPGIPGQYREEIDLDPQFVAERKEDATGKFIEIGVRHGKTPDIHVLALLPVPYKKSQQTFVIIPGENSRFDNRDADPQERANLGKIAKAMRAHKASH